MDAETHVVPSESHAIASVRPSAHRLSLAVSWAHGLHPFAYLTEQRSWLLPILLGPNLHRCPFNLLQGQPVPPESLQGWPPSQDSPSAEAFRRARACSC